jgi:hypothetical protein
MAADYAAWPVRGLDSPVSCHAAGDPNFLDLTNFTLNKARLKLIWEF